MTNKDSLAVKDGTASDALIAEQPCKKRKSFKEKIKKISGKESKCQKKINKLEKKRDAIAAEIQMLSQNSREFLQLSNI